MIADSERPASQDGVTDSQLWRIDQICDGFETAWKSARRPRIEAFLEPTMGPGSPASPPRARAPRCPLPEAPGRISADHRLPASFSRADRNWLDAELTSDPRDAIASCGAGGHSAEGSRENPDPSSSPVEVGQARTLGKFQLLERVGVGGFGTVWRALDIRLNRIVALKIPARPPDRNRRGCREVLPGGAGGCPASTSWYRDRPRGHGSQRVADPRLRFRHRHVPARSLT